LWSTFEQLGTYKAECRDATAWEFRLLCVVTATRTRKQTKRKDTYFIQVLYYKYGHNKCYFFSLFLISQAKKRCHLRVGIRCRESARMQDLAPFTRELLGALRGRRLCSPHSFAAYFLIFSTYFKFYFFVN